jgi:putative N6-adenine-specific DNA methylase
LGARLPRQRLTAEAEEVAPAVPLIVARLDHDRCTLSLDSSGALLHQRGYRRATAKAPLRETLAAGMLLASGWDRQSPLLDPFCGSGTIAVEAACLALRLAPGRNRSFAFMDWPGFDAGLWSTVTAEAETRRLTASPVIQASDRDTGAIAAARDNAARAGVSQAIEFSNRAVSAIEPPKGPGWVVTNPPYGLRLGDAGDLRNLYARFGQVLRRLCPDWRVALLASDTRLARATGLAFDPARTVTLVNGGLKVKLLCANVVGAELG